MRPIPVSLLLLSILVVQVAALWGRVGEALRPDLLLLPCIYFALWFPVRQAALAAVAAGFLRDLHSIGPMGLSSLSFATAAVAVAALREEVYREHPLTQAIIGGTVSLIPIGFTLIHLILIGSFAALPDLVGPGCISALHTALFAPLLIGPLRAMGGLWGQPAPYRLFPARI